MLDSRDSSLRVRRHSLERCYWDDMGYDAPRLDLPRLRQTAREGCIRCQILLEGIEKFEYLPPDHQEPEVGFSEDTIRIFISLDPPNPLEVIVVCPKTPKSKRRDPLTLEFYSHADQCLPFPGFCIAGDVPTESSSEMCVATIQQWERTCEAEHSLCKPISGHSMLPTRLLSVGIFGDDPRLCLSSCIPEETKYIALSHTWGKKEDRIKPMPLTLRGNIASRQEKVPWSELTKTFQDAVTITRNLGLQYLWIDSLCIVQDDKDDWAAEAGRMASIYKNAHLVVSATASRKGDDGCFMPRSPSHELTKRDNTGRTITAYVKQQVSHRQLIEAPATSSTMPLFDRAWCFQERLLARRVIHYTEQEIMWECQERLWCECEGIQSGRDCSKGIYTGNFKLTYAQALATPDTRTRFQIWGTIVEEYSLRSLTFESDRLTALSGIASEMNVLGMGRYLAGLWQGCLPQMLLWSTAYSIVEKGWTRTRQDPYQAPTWSWASVTGAISMLVDDSEAKVEYVCHVKDVDCTLATADPYGQVLDGYLIVEAPTREAYVVASQHAGVDGDEETYHVCWDAYTRRLDHDIPLDPDMLNKAPVLILVVSYKEYPGPEDRDKTWWEGIVLRELKRRIGCWERVGYNSGRVADLGATELRKVTIL